MRELCKGIRNPVPARHMSVPALIVVCLYLNMLIGPSGKVTLKSEEIVLFTKYLEQPKCPKIVYTQSAVASTSGFKIFSSIHLAGSPNSVIIIMGSNFSLNNAIPPRSPPQSNSGYTRVEPEWSGSTSEGYRQLGTVRKSGYPAEEVAMPPGGQFILAPSTSTSEITADEKGIQLIDSSNSRLELEGTLEFKIESFLIKTRKIISKGEHGFGIGVDTKHFEPRSFKATLIEDEGAIRLTAMQDSKEIKLKIRSRNKRNRIMIDDLNTCGIVWIRVLALK